MRTLPKIEGTRIRAGTYYSNLRIPASLRARHGGKSHLVLSLRTSDPKRAEEDVLLLRAQLIDEARALDRRINAEAAIADLPPDQRRILEEAGGVDSLIAELERTKEALAFSVVGKTDYESDIPTSRFGEELDRAADEAVHRKLRDTAVQEAKTLSALGFDAEMPGGYVRGLRELASAYFEEHGTPKLSQRAYLYPVRRFIELHGDLPLEEITVEHLRVFAQEAKSLTSSRKNGVHKLSFRDNVKVAQSQGLPLMTFEARKKAIEHLKYLTKWGAPVGYLKDGDPFAGFTIKPPRTKFSAKKKIRRPFNGEEAKTMLSFVRHHRHPQTVDYWGPLIMAYQGARREETAQLRVCDVRQIDGEWIIRITDEGEDGKVKNHSSLRNLPVHPEVVEAGFLDFVQARQAAPEDYLFRQETRKGSGRLVDLSLDADERISGAWGKRFNADLKAAGVKKEGLTLYSFRHTWETCADHAEINDKHRRALAGRASNDPDSQDHYGDGPSIRQGKAALSKIDPLSVVTGLGIRGDRHSA
ncbi:MAG: site-specific integrase [Pseudomonadota bacterium]